MPAYPQGVAPLPGQQFVRVGATGQEPLATYQCTVTTKDAGVEKTIVQAASEDAARKTAARKFGSRSTGSVGVSCAATAKSASPADPSTQNSGVKTRAPTPVPFEAVRPGVEFLADGSCKLSQQAIAAHPDAREYCQGDPLSKGVVLGCPATYCARLVK